MRMPPIATGVVTQQFPDTGQLQVLLKSTGAATTAPVMVGYHGFADALRVSQKPLPVRGTWGIVAFPDGDVRNGVWLCAYYPNRADAITASSDNNLVPSDAFIDYESHWSGLFRLLDAHGQFAVQFPDGSSLVVGTSSGVPTVYRHTVDDSGARQRIKSGLGDRVSGSPSPFGLTFLLNGGLALTAGSGITLTASGTSIYIDPAGNVDIRLGGGTFNIGQGSGTPTDALALVSKLTSQLQTFQSDYNAHHHQVTGVSTGGGSVTSQGPNNSFTLGDISATDIKIDK